MTATQTTIALRIDKNIRARLEELAESEGFANLSEFLRIVLTDYAQSYPKMNNSANALQMQKQQLVDGNTCPILRIFAGLRCSRCIFRKEKNTEISKSVEEEFSKETA